MTTTSSKNKSNNYFFFIYVIGLICLAGALFVSVFFAS
jgi:hypothetical protein